MSVVGIWQGMRDYSLCVGIIPPGVLEYRQHVAERKPQEPEGHGTEASSGVGQRVEGRAGEERGAKSSTTTSEVPVR